MRKRMPKGLIFLFLLGFVSPLWAQSGSSVQYVYDALGRLTQVIDPSGNVATYNYDAVGNLLSITRSTTSPSSLAIFSFSPAQGSVGQTVTIQGQNFSATPSSNTVKFNVTTATVTAATTSTLTTTVPTGATTGPISVSVGSSTATSSNNFTVLAVPVVTSVTPTQALNTPMVNFTVNGSNLTGATFSFLPVFSPAAITVSNVNINGNGTSATMTLTLATNAAGSFTVVATNGNGSTSSVPSVSNTLTIVATDPFADFDGDGLTNIYESAITTNYAAASTTADGLPDGWALFYTGTPPLNAGLAGQTAPNGLTYLQSFQRGLNPIIPNLVPPSVANVYPANLATNYPTNGVVVVRFTEALLAGVDLAAAQNAINAALPTGSNFSAANASAAAQVLQGYLQRTCCVTTAVPGSVQVLQNGKPVAGTVYLSNDRLSITFAPTLNLSASTLYTVSVQNVRDAAGNLMTQPFQSSFTAGLAANKITGGAVFTNPPNAATGVETNAPFRMLFSAPVNPATLTSQNLFITDTFTGLAVPGTLQTDAFGFTASFVPSQPYGAGRQFNVTLTSGIQDVSGNSFPASSFFFTTGFSPDNQGFKLVGTSPSDGATGVPLNALVVLEFEEPVDEISALTGLQVQLAGAPISGAIALSDGNKRITFTPTVPLTANSTYLVVTTPQLTDFSGNQLSNPDSSTFTTGSANDTTTPTVVGVSPAPTATGVPTNTRVQLKFNKPIDPLTVTNSTFFIFPSFAGAGLTAASISVSADGMTATLTPTSPLVPETSYVINPTSGITDLVGQALQPGAFCFTCTAFTTGLSATTTAPTVVTVSPPNGISGVQVNARINVLLSAPVAIASVGSNAITVSTNSTPVAGTISVSSDQMTLTFVPSSLLAVSTTYTVSVSGFTDQAGNPVAQFTSTFTTGTSGVADTTHLAVVSVNPPNGATAVPVNSTVVVTFNKNVDPRTVNSTSVALLDNSLGLAGTYAVNGAVVTFTPISPLPGSTMLQVAVNGGTLDLAGNGISVGFNSSFTTAAVADTTAPQVVSVTPNNGATGIGPNAKVVLTFSKSVNPNTVNANTIGLLVNGTKLSNVTFGTSPDNRVVTMILIGGTSFPASRTVAVLATSGVTDFSGNALVSFASTFTTAFDTTHSNVIGQRPANGATGVPVSTGVVLYVNEPMNATTIPGALHVSQNGVTVTGTTQVTDSGQVIQFTPSAPFQNNALVQVFLDSTALDTDGNSLSSYQASFTTIPSITAGPNVVNTNPGFVSGVPTNVIIDIGFDQTLSPATVNTTTVSLLQGTNTVASTVSLVGGGTVVQVAPNALLTPNTNYVVQITSGLQGANGLAAPFPGSVLSFTTGTGTDTVSPTVSLVSPPDGFGNVGDNANIRVRFSKAINPLTVTGSTIAISGGSVTQVPYALSFTSSQEVLIAPYSPLPDATQMSVAVSGVTDVAGNTVVPKTTHFTTATGPDTLIPTVISSNPFSGEKNVPLNVPIMVGINEPIDAGTVNGNAFSVQDQSTGQQVVGNYSVSVDGQTISFAPSALLTASRNYFVSFPSNGIANLAGNPLSNPGGRSNYSFTTGTTTNATQPQVTGVSPANGLTGIPINAQVVIQFNEPIDGVTIKQVTLTGNGTVTVTPVLSNGNQMLALVPVAPLNPGTTYTVTITGVQDIAGNSLSAPVTTTFTTGSGADVKAPTVASTVPVNGSTGVLTNTVIQLHFNKPIDPLTVTNSTFQVYPSNGGPAQAIAGTIQVSPDGLTATLTPIAPLATSTAYSISLSLGILDLEGQSLVSQVLSFTTGTQ